EGGLGLRGIGSGGGGSGFGAGVGVGSLSAAAKATPKVRLGAKAIRGKLDPQVIQRVVRSKMSRIRACYEKELLRGDFSTKIVTSFVIGSSGRVTSIKLSQASKRGSLDSCVQQVFRTMHFPAPKGGGIVTVSYPLVFSSK
ncbi:MAG TPA: AgmX/PglI C-terminal domain-containing protein, partial [Polyangiaceae bacterium]|nr:AgmX/PglI C-terminal domain-containing protein [Polyangiaceae bacterium]